VRAEEPEALAGPRALARFLCGLTSPALTRRKLGRNSVFGRLARVPFAEVLRRAEAEGGPA
jgi:ATP-dependent DNA helicase RecQ